MPALVKKGSVAVTEAAAGCSSNRVQVYGAVVGCKGSVTSADGLGVVSVVDDGADADAEEDVGVLALEPVEDCLLRDRDLDRLRPLPNGGCCCETDEDGTGRGSLKV